MSHGHAGGDAVVRKSLLCGVENDALSLADSWPSVNQHGSGLACADGFLTWSDPGNGRSALPSLWPVSTFHIQYYTNADPLPSHHTFHPRCLLQLPLDSSFFFFFYPPQHKMWPAASHSRTEKSLSRLVASTFLGTPMYCQCRKM